MADNGSSPQPLIAAFAFGIIANVASAAVFLFLAANGPPLFKDSLRLVLVVFLFSSALWAFVDFVSMTVDSDSACHVAVAFGTAFDQLARVAFEQFVLWGANAGAKPSMGVLIPQLAVLLRFVLGGIYVGFQRPQFNPVCLSTASVLPLGIAILAADAVVTLFLLAKLLSTGKSASRTGNEVEAKRSRTLITVLAGAGFWTALSAPMILGVRSLGLFPRKTLPAIGLLVLIVALILSKDRLLATDDASDSKLFAADSAPREYQMSNFVPGPRNSNNSRSITQRPLSRYDNPTGEGTTTRISAMGPSSYNKVLPKINHPNPGQSAIGIGGVPVAGQLFPPMRPERPEESITPGDTNELHTLPAERSKSSKKKKKQMKNAEITISGPVLNHDSLNPLNRIATIDLETAARNERERREANPQPPGSYSSIARGPPSLAITADQMAQRSRSVSNRKAVGPSPVVAAKKHLEPILEAGAASATTSAQLSPGIEEIRRRSPRQPQKPFQTQAPPPLPPLKTPGTMGALTPKTPKQPTQPDTWDLLSIPQGVGTEAPVAPPPRSPKRPQLPSNPAATGIATMTQSSQPDGAGRMRRTSSTSSARLMNDEAMFTDPSAPPPIPQRHIRRNDSIGIQTPGQTPRGNPPPPYQLDNPSSQSPLRGTTGESTAHEPSALLDTNSPSKPETKLFLFPPGYANKGPAGFSQHTASTGGKAPKSPLAISKGPGGANPTPAGKEHESSMDKAVFFLRNIVYNKPPPTKVVSVTADKPLPESAGLGNRVRESVLNRPRPIPRTPETGSLFHTQTGFHHRSGTQRRSMSCSSITPQKNILFNTAPGNPCQLPPLPPIPLEGDAAPGELPTNAESMELEDETDSLHPGPQRSVSSSSKSTRRRSSSMPEIPMNVEMPNIPLPLPKRPSSEGREGSLTNRSTMSSVRTQSILNIVDTDRSHFPQYTSNPVAEAAHTGTERHRYSWESWESSSQGQSSTSETDVRPSSIPSRSDPITQVTPMVPEVHGGQTLGHSSPGQPRTGESLVLKTHYIEASPSIDASGEGIDGYGPAAEMTPSEALASDSTAPVSHYPNSRGFTDNSESGPSGRGNHTGHNAWHHRIGQECPTFSYRRGTVRSRRGPPPTPLLLNKPNKTIIVQAEPSPLESPEHALGMIEAQLQKLERASRTSSLAEQQRMTLIADLEKEMGLQEDHWQNLRHTIVRDSLSTLHLSPVPDMPTRVPSWVAIQERRSRHLADSVANSSEHSESVAPLKRAPGRYEASNRSSTSRRSNADNRMSLLTVSHPTTAQLGSPTPPDTEESGGEEHIEVPLMYADTVDMVQTPAPSLWCFNAPSPIIFKHTPSLWSPTMGASFSSAELPCPAVPAPRTGTRRPLEPLTIESRHLWFPEKKAPAPASQGLWGSSSQPASASPPAEKRKPRAQKPLVRRSRRMTALPDILESPEPLPNKRGTLGIFQFPWGEKSDTAIIPPPAFSFGAMPGTMTSGRAMVHPASVPNFQIAQPQPSFFDMCDEEDAGDNFSDFDSEGDDDDFDEATLWEIASLLQSDRITSPGTVTLAELPRGDQRTSVVASPTESLESPEDVQIPMVLDVASLQPSKPNPSSLWQGKTGLFQVEKTKGLPQPDQKTWGSYLEAMAGSTRSLKRTAGPASINSRELWSAPALPTEPASSTFLWRPKKNEAHLREFPAEDDAAEKDTPRHRLARPRVVTAAEWDTPLAEAIKASGLAPPAASNTAREPVVPVNESTNSAGQLWSRPAAPAPAPVPATAGGMWQKPHTMSAEPSPTLIQPPRHDRKPTVVAAGDSAPADFADQQLWNRPNTIALGKDERQDWLSKMKRSKQMSFDGDVELVQRFLDRRWGGSVV
ncbi:hypothetical protein ACRE_032600 [Hapsidospora chrysogenum ATCC 11550]|uniref:Uncharacterized protein n=1 Tax=Hapsidospora chrysogenum (strain ATCC 11550 / CBS 779.69 / DSM 880 / IAM 14645 / JCM 23072 / IMI 49137) TaxID=857340 RepID=A0A086T9B8_HAPC1|nr:hypothetical protein ACRE_032600 [Hapsidospora chrysogenum ATCC 11550]